MSLDALILFVGAVIAILPFLGFPISWLLWMFFVLGVCVIALGVAVRRRGNRIVHKRLKKGAFVESYPEKTLPDDEGSILRPTEITPNAEHDREIE